MVVLGAVVDQQENVRCGERIYDLIEERLGLTIDPMKVLKNDNRRLAEALSHQYLLDSLQSAPPPQLRIELRQRLKSLSHAQEGIQIG
jgi:hypothetical protein